MVRKITSIVCLGTALAVLSFASSWGPDTTVERRYVSSDGRTLEGAGVCEVTVEHVRCWDMAGAPDPDLESRSAEFFSSKSLTGAKFQLGKKNRYLVIRASGPGAFATYSNGEGSYNGPGVLNNSNKSASDHLEWIAFGFPRDAVSGGCVAWINEVPTKPVTVAMAKGQAIDFPDAKLLIGEWVNASPGAASWMDRGDLPDREKAWAVIFGYDARPDSGNLTIQALDRDGKPMEYVDRQGDPVPAAKVKPEFVHGPRYGGFSGPMLDRSSFGGPPPNAKLAPWRYARATFVFGGPSTPLARTAYTNINPARIPSIQVTRMVYRRVLIEGFPLDPVKS